MNTKKKNNTYSIGEVAALLGISPDSLRHYEKRGLITSGKLDNGYRYYTNEDLRSLLCILYYRKMDISLNNISVLIKHSSTSTEMLELIESRIHEEEQTILRHRQNIARLKLSRLQYERTRTYKKGFSIQPFPKSYMIDECSSSQDIILRWFQRAQETPGLDMAYFFDEYDGAGPDKEPVYQRSRLLLYVEAAAALPEEFELSGYPLTDDMDCVCYSLSAPSAQLPSRLIREMSAWAEQMGYTVAGCCLTTNIAAGEDSKGKSIDLELYLPVIKS